MNVHLLAKLCIVCVLSATPIMSFAKDARECVTIKEKKHGNECGKPGGVKILYGNDCTVQIDIKFCLQRTDGRPSCGLTTVKPGQSTSTWVCEGTGKYWYEARTFGSDDRFDDERNIDWSRR